MSKILFGFIAVLVVIAMMQVTVEACKGGSSNNEPCLGVGQPCSANNRCCSGNCLGRIDLSVNPPVQYQATCSDVVLDRSKGVKEIHYQSDN